MTGTEGKDGNPLFEIREVDRVVYERELAPFLPDEILDVHTHVWRGAKPRPGPAGGKPRTVSWPSRVARENPIEDLLETYRLMLPGKRVTPLIFGTLPRGRIQLDEVNGYVADCSRRAGVPALLFTDPLWSAAELDDRIAAGGFLGAKSYLTLAPGYLPAGEIRIFDFFPPHQLEAHDRHGRVVMLHIPRPARLRDPVNLAQLLEIDRGFPNLNLIVAHVGRAYCNADVGDAFDILAETRRIRFDISANTNAAVFEGILRCVGPRRVLFGSDLPILRMRMRRVTRGGRYVNLVPRGLYGDVSGDPNLGEVDGAEAGRLTFFLYEELRAFRRAARRAGLSRADVEDVFHNNARRMLDAARSK